MKRTVVTLAVTLWILAVGWPLEAFEIRSKVDWEQLEVEGRLPVEAKLSFQNEVGSVVEIAHSGTGELELTLLTLERPEIEGLRWSLSGTVKYEGVEGEAYLEMNSCFGNGDCFFSRTMAPEGPMAVLQGTETWRSVVLPFVSQAKLGTPQRLELRLVMPSAGTVVLGPMVLGEFAEGEYPLAEVSISAWWSPRVSGWIGGIGGSLLGLWGALFGLLAGKGKGRGFVLAGLWLMVGTGVLALIFGALAVAVEQPYGVWYLLVLMGVLLVVLGGGLLPIMKRRYAAFEERRMRFLDL